MADIVIDRTDAEIKVGIEKASDLQSSASEIDGRRRHIENRVDISTVENFISKKAINILGDSISVDYRSYGNSIKFAFNKLLGSSNFGFPYQGFGLESDESNVLQFADAPNSLTGRFVVIEPTESADMSEYKPSYQYFKNKEKVRFFYDDTQIGFTFSCKFYDVEDSLLQTDNFTTDSSGVTSFITAPEGAIRLEVTNTYSTALHIENPQIITNEDDYTVSVMGTAGRALSYTTYSVLDKWFDNAEYAVLGLNTNDTQNNPDFENKISYIESKYNSASNNFTKLVIIDLSADKAIHHQVVARLEQMHKNCVGSYYMTIRDIFGTDDVDKMISLGLINVDRVHPIVPFGQAELSNGILKRLGFADNYYGLWEYKNSNNIYADSIAGIDIKRGGNNLPTNINIGENSGFYLTKGKENVAIGYETNLLATTQNKSTSIGYKAGRGNVSGFNNTNIGCEAGHSSTGSGHTLIGVRAGYSLNAGHYNTFIGESAGNLKLDGSANNSTTNTTCIGRNTKPSGSNQVQLGDSSTTTYAYGAVQDRSDMRDKADIKDLELGLDYLMKVRPVSFKWDMRDDYVQSNEDGTVSILPKDGSKKRNRFHHGVIAQEIKALNEQGYEFGGIQDHSLSGGSDVLSIGYEEFIPILMKSIQEQQLQIEDLKNRIGI